MLDHARVVPGPERVRPGALGEREQRVEAERAVAGGAGVRRVARRVARRERVDHRGDELLAEVERDVREAERVTAGAGGCDCLGGAAGPLGRGARRVLPEAKRHTYRVRRGAQERDGAVDAAAHRHRGAPRLVLGDEHLPDRGRERLERERDTSNRSGLEQGQPRERAVDTVGVRVDDAVSVHDEPHGGPLAAARGIADDLHRAHRIRLDDRQAAPSAPSP